MWVVFLAICIPSAAFRFFHNGEHATPPRFLDDPSSVYLFPLTGPHPSTSKSGISTPRISGILLPSLKKWHPQPSNPYSLAIGREHARGLFGEKLFPKVGAGTHMPRTAGHGAERRISPRMDRTADLTCIGTLRARIQQGHTCPGHVTQKGEGNVKHSSGS